LQVDQIIGHDRQPSIFDRDSMPYSVATIIELLRYAALVSTVPHAALETTTLQGYTIPAGTALMPLFPVVLYDTTFWGDPEEFRPERFLDDKGQLLPPDHPNRKHMMQFGGGTRVCVGEAFAQKRLFIFLASMVQSFDLVAADNPLVPCDHDSHLQGGILVHRPYTIKLVLRQLAK
jgi:cytochrome P450 family 2 subfamily U polypeptide 1